MIVLYSNDCPRCKVLKSKLDSKKIEYEVTDNFSDIIKAGFLTAPVLKVDDKFMDFSKANEWINAQE